MSKQWFVIHTYSGFERKVKLSIEEQFGHSSLGARFSEVIIPTEVDLLFHSDKNRYRSNYSKDASPPFKYLSILNLQREEVRFSEREWGLSYSHPYLELAECFRQGGWNVNLKVVGFTQV